MPYTPWAWICKDLCPALSGRSTFCPSWRITAPLTTNLRSPGETKIQFSEKVQCRQGVAACKTNYYTHQTVILFDEMQDHHASTIQICAKILNAFHTRKSKKANALEAAEGCASRKFLARHRQQRACEGQRAQANLRAGDASP
jgi:hypothetical protein